MIDAHCHLSDSRCSADVDTILSRGSAAGVQRWVLGGTDPGEWERQAELARRHPGKIVQNYGLHPWWIERMSRDEIEASLAALETCLPEAAGLGETGLDFYDKRDASRFDDQRAAFRRQLRLALRFQKPLVLHVVKAFDETLSILIEEGVGEARFSVPVVLHRFSGNEQQARPFLDRGAYLSFTGAFLDPERGKKSARALQATPATQLLLETDGPDTPFESLAAVYAGAAQAKQLELAELTRQLALNVQAVWCQPA